MSLDLLPPPRGYVSVIVCLSVSIRTDLHEIFRESWQWANEQMIKLWWRSRSQIGIATLVRRALVDVFTVPVLLVYTVIKTMHAEVNKCFTGNWGALEWCPATLSKHEKWHSFPHFTLTDAYVHQSGGLAGWHITVLLWQTHSKPSTMQLLGDCLAMADAIVQWFIHPNSSYITEYKVLYRRVVFL